MNNKQTQVWNKLTRNILANYKQGLKFGGCLFILFTWLIREFVGRILGIVAIGFFRRIYVYD